MSTIFDINERTDNRPSPIPDQSVGDTKFVQTSQSYEQPSAMTTHDTSRSRGGDSRSECERVSRNSKKDSREGWINLSQQRRNIRQQENTTKKTET